MARRSVARRRSWQVLCGDCRDLLLGLSLADAVVTDPPYGLEFMGRGWDHGVPDADTWKLVLGAVKPGAHLLAFGGTRTFHRLACAIEDAGWELRDCVGWIYGSGWPKAKAALKPAWEPILMARAPMVGSMAANIREHGTGGLNIEGCRVGTTKDVPASPSRSQDGRALSGSVDGSLRHETGQEGGHNPNIGRWPANVIHDGSPEVLGVFPASHGSGRPRPSDEKVYVTSNKVYGAGVTGPAGRFGDEGSAARFFYCAKASRKERGEGNDHPTVKPLALMRYLVRLVTPAGGVVLDPFAGSGSTGVAAIQEDLRFIGIDLDPRFCDIARDRLASVGTSA